MPCSSRPARYSAWWPSTPAAGTAAGPCSPRSSVRRRSSAWTGRPATARRSPGRCSTAPRTCRSPAPPGAQSAERIEWLWLLHDDCEPAPDALEQLLRGTVETSSAAVLGPKLRDWSNREVILEAGVTLDTATRRVTGIEPREVDQGQHDGDRDALAVSSAGMLVRRDVWEQVGGFDTGMGLFMEDIDFCWRVHAAGYRVRVITDAIAYHLQAATRHRRAVSVGRRARMLDRSNGLLTLLGNLPFRQMMMAAVGQRPGLAAADQLLPARQATGRGHGRDDGPGRRALPSVQADQDARRGAPAAGGPPTAGSARTCPPGRSARRLAEFAASALSKSQPDTGRCASRDRLTRPKTTRCSSTTGSAGGC